MEITASLVKELREKTGVGLMNCKKALSESNGDIESAIKSLREKGLASASKKAERTTNEGRVFITSQDNQSVILELNCETDFVANNNDFATLGNSLATFISENSIADTAALESASINGKSYTEYLSEYILKLGENIAVSKFQTVSSDGSLSNYVHANGKIGVIVNFSGNISSDLGKDIAMHVAATNPSCVRPEEVNSDDIANEKNIIRTQALNEGKPEQVIEKIVEGRINKFYKEVCLNEQTFVKDDKQSVKSLLPSGVSITSFIRFSLI